MSQERCTRCGKKNARGSNFCSECGLPISGGGGQCPSCGRPVGSADRFCMSCGGRLPGERGPVVVQEAWRRTAEDFATLLEGYDIESALKKGLAVEQGTEALLFVNGKLIDRLAPGRHTLETMGDRVKAFFGKGRSVKVVLVDAGIAPVRLGVGGLKTSDPLFVKLETELAFRVQHPEVFYLNLFKGRTSLGIDELTDLLRNEVRDALRDSVGAMTAKEISSELKVKERLAVEAERHLSQSLKLYGMELVQFRTLSMSHSRYDALQGVEEDLLLQVWEKESKLTGRRKLFEVLNQEELQEIYEATTKLGTAEKRVDVFSRMRKVVNSDKMDEVRSEEALAAFLMEVDKDRLLRKEEMDELTRSFGEQKEDHELARRHLLAKLALEQHLEIRRLELMGEASLEQDLLKAKLDTERIRFERELALERERKAALREEQFKDQQNRLERDLAEARNEEEKAAIKLRIQQAKTEFGLAILDKMRASKLRFAREQMLLEAEQKERDLTLRLKERAHEQQLELERIRALSEASVEALISIAGPQQAAMLAELKRTEVLGSWSEEQILAEAAKHSPEVAKAFQERFKGLGAEEIKNLYERMLKERELVTEGYRREQQQTRQDFKEVALEALRSSRQGPQVVYPPPGTPLLHVQSGVASNCPSCGLPLSPGASFCNSCGQGVR
ncbi:MAG: zinc ribbon domain-containing protein [Thermodesulfobacteriota bacterium]